MPMERRLGRRSGSVPVLRPPREEEGRPKRMAIPRGEEGASPLVHGGQGGGRPPGRNCCGDPREEEGIAAGPIGPGRRRGRPYIVGVGTPKPLPDESGVRAYLP